MFLAPAVVAVYLGVILARSNPCEIGNGRGRVFIYFLLSSGESKQWVFVLFVNVSTGYLKGKRDTRCCFTNLNARLAESVPVRSLGCTLVFIGCRFELECCIHLCDFGLCVLFLSRRGFICGTQHTAGSQVSP